METGHDILYFWVMRMIMLSLALTGKVPFHFIMLNRILRSSSGKKSPKVNQNATIDPLKVNLVDEKILLAMDLVRKH